MLLSSGEFTRVTVFLALQTDFTDQILRTFPNLFLVLLEYQNRSHHHVFQGSLMREKVELLKNHAYFFPEFKLVELGIVDLPSMNLDRTRIDVVEGVDAADQGRFAGTGRPDDADHFAFFYIETDSLQHLEITEGFVNVFQGNDGLFRIHFIFTHMCFSKLNGITFFQPQGPTCNRIAIGKEDHQGKTVKWDQ